MTSLLFAALISLTPLSPTQAVLERLEIQRKAWNDGDLEKFCSFYADDAVFISPKGKTKGRAEVLARYKKSYPDKKAMGTLTFEVLDTRSSAAHVSIAAKWKLSYTDKKEASGHTLIVWESVGDKWLLTQDASM